MSLWCGCELPSLKPTLPHTHPPALQAASHAVGGRLARRPSRLPAQRTSHLLPRCSSLWPQSLGRMGPSLGTLSCHLGLDRLGCRWGCTGRKRRGSFGSCTRGCSHSGRRRGIARSAEGPSRPAASTCTMRCTGKHCPEGVATRPAPHPALLGIAVALARHELAVHVGVYAALLAQAARLPAVFNHPFGPSKAGRTEIGGELRSPRGCRPQPKCLPPAISSTGKARLPFSRSALDDLIRLRFCVHPPHNTCACKRAAHRSEAGSQKPSAA